MIRQTDKGVRPFYAFPEVTVISLVYKRWWGHKEDEWSQNVRLAGGEIIKLKGLYGRAINRPKAVDPVSGKQWNISLWCIFVFFGSVI